MSKMLRLELVGLVLLACTQILTEHRDFYGYQNQYGQQRHYDSQDVKLWREVRVAEGRLRGVVHPKGHRILKSVDVFLGVPYAAPPLGSLRFTPPQSPRPWSGVRHSNTFAPVCHQVLPELHSEVTSGRYEYLQRLLPYLTNQSEDCLYLNIYAPHQTEAHRLRRYPVMVFIHGESFEWNSGNPYDGTMLASYGDVVFVTINFRLGILGFLRPGTSDSTSSNFGLLDQVAALLWLKENIAVFGGDPNSVTLVGHGTGAIFVNLLLISPVASKEAGLFKRGILMSGSALSANAIGKAPLQVTEQVAHAVNCPTTNDTELAICLQSRPVDSLLNVRIDKPLHVPAYAPLKDGTVVPEDPFKLMERTDIFGRYDLMYGVTESEKFFAIPPLYLSYGLVDDERDQLLREHIKATHELEPEMVLSEILEHYGEFTSTVTNDYVFKNREIILQSLSDSDVVAPLILTGKMHARTNPKSYMYVFSHPRAVQEYHGQQQRQHTVHGEELPYILGIPVGGSKYHLQDRYNIGEALFSEAMMTWWCNFAHTGNPNAPRRSEYLTDGRTEWQQYELDWPEYDLENQTYFNLTIPPQVGTRYRAAEMKFWNEVLPELIRRPNMGEVSVTTRKPKNQRPKILDFADGITEFPGHTGPNVQHKTHDPAGARAPEGNKLEDKETFGGGTVSEDSPVDSTATDKNSSTTPESSAIKNSSAISLVVGFGVAFLLINLTAFFYLYRKRHNLKNKEKSLKRRLSQKDEGSKRSKIPDRQTEKNVELGQKNDSRPDLNEVLKNDKAYDNNSNFGRRSKLSRQNSSSTIDTHIKVREWIQQEIVHRCSPRFLRKTRETLQKEHQEKLNKQQEEERRKLQLEKLITKKEEPVYAENPTITVRPGKKLKPSRVPKVSVAVDATPATRTESVLNQIPIELTPGEREPYPNQLDEIQSETLDSSSGLTSPQLVVIEHHHSKSDPLPLEGVFKMTKTGNLSSQKISDSDCGSASSLYAKINTKLKFKYPKVVSPLSSGGELSASSNKTGSENLYDQVSTEESIYGAQAVPKFTTFESKVKGSDINVTCREPTMEREAISPEEALKTIKRRKYPKVLPDIEKRRSLPVPSSLFIPKQYGNSLRDYKNDSQPNSPIGENLLPSSPPRIFGTSKSLDLAEERESQYETEPITTNLHVGPLLKRQDSTTKNNSDPNLIETMKRKGNHSKVEKLSMNQSQSSGNINGNIHGIAMKTQVNSPEQFSASSLNEPSSFSANWTVKKMGNPNWYKPKPMQPSLHMGASVTPSSVPDLSIGNPNWYKPLTSASSSHNNGTNDISSAILTIPAVNETQAAIAERENIVVKPFVVPGDGNNSKHNLVSNSARNFETPINSLQQNWESKGPAEPKIVITPRVGNLLGQSGQSLSYTVSNMGAGISQKILDEGPKVAAPSRLNLPAMVGQDVVLREEKKEPKIIITANNSAKNSAPTSLKHPKIIIKPSTNPSHKPTRDNKNIPKVSAIPSPECQTLKSNDEERSFEKDQAVHHQAEKPPLKEKPKVTRIPSFSKRKDDQVPKLEKAWSPVYAEKAEIIQTVEAVPNSKVTDISPSPTKDLKSGIPMFSKKTTEKSPSIDSSNSTENSGASNTGTIKKKPFNRLHKIG